MTHPLRRLLFRSRAHRKTIWCATACSLLNKLFDLFPPILIAGVVDAFTRGADSWLGRNVTPEPMDQLWWLFWANLVVWGFESLFEYLYARMWRNLAQAVQHELRVEAYAHLQRVEPAWLAETTTGNLLAVVNEDVNQLERFLDVGADRILRMAATVVMIGGAFLWTQPELAWLSFLPIPLIVWGSMRFQRLLEPRYAEVRAKAGEAAGLIAGNLGGMATIHSYVAEAKETERVRRASSEYRKANTRAISVSAAFNPLIRMTILLGFSVMLLRGGYLVEAGALEISAFSGMLFLVQRLLWPLTALGEVLDLYQRGMASTARVLDLLDVPAAEEGALVLEREAVRGEIRFEGVHFAYGGRVPALRGVDLVARAGEVTAVVGLTGSGKTTLVRLLLRFHRAQEGRVTLDGHDVLELDGASLRRAVAYVAQDAFLFDGSVHENVEYGAGAGAVEDAIELAEAGAFVRALPEAGATRVGERGQKLSGGERQRLALARAIHKDAPVLVLDEATSAVDNETEAAIQRSLARIAPGRTLLVIAHRLSTVRSADRIYVLDQGRVAEQGTHDELVERGGAYAALWRVQTGVENAFTA